MAVVGKKPAGPTSAPSANAAKYFKRAEKQAPVYRLIGASDGLEKTGKTDFELKLKKPMALINIDTGLEGVIEKHDLASEQIHVMDIRVDTRKGASPQDVAKAADEQWQSFVNAYKAVLSDPYFASIAIDTGTEAWEMLRLARFGKLTQVMPHHYGPVNAEYRDLIRWAYDSDKNLWITHKVKDEWIDGADGKGKRTGNVKRSGFSDTGFMVQINVRHWRNDAEEGLDKFHMTVTDCRQNPMAIGEDFQGEAIEFWQLGVLVFPDSQPENWM